MTLRTRFLITALFVCHQLLGPPLVTSQLLSVDAGSSGQQEAETKAAPAQSSTASAGSTTSSRCTPPSSQDPAATTICALAQEKTGNLYQLHGDAEIHYRNYILRADEVSYNSDNGEATGTGHFQLDGGPNDDHIKASHGTYNLTAETGKFYDVTGTTGVRFQGSRPILTSTAPFAFTGKIVEKTAPDHYVVFDGTITTCELPHPMWEYQSHKAIVDVGGKAQVYNSTFWLHGIPVFFFPYATNPVERGARDTGFLAPTVGRSSTNGNEVGDAFYWAINRSMDAMIGAELFSKRGWSQRGEFRARPSDSSYVDLNYFGVIDRGTPIGVTTTTNTGTTTTTENLREGGEEARLAAEWNWNGLRALSNVDYLSSFLFRLAFNEIYTQAINSEVKSQVFLAKASQGFFLSGMVERYQNFFQTATGGVLSNPPGFEAIQIWHSPSLDASSTEHPLGRGPVYWSFDSSLTGLARSEPGFTTGSPLARFDFNPEISMPLQFHQWSLRPALALHETYYSNRFVNGQSVNDPTNRQALETTVEIRPPVLEKVFDKEFLGRKWKHVIEPYAQYRLVTGVNDFAQVLHFDERDILSNTHEVEYGFVTRLYAKRLSSKQPECETPMNGLAVGAPAPEQLVPWQPATNVDNLACVPSSQLREVFTWELAQKYFLDPTFGGALVTGSRNVFTTTEELTGIAFLTQPRHLSPIVSRLRAATSTHTDTEWDLDYDFQLGRINSSTLLVNYNIGPVTVGGGDAFLQIPQTTAAASTPSEGKCAPTGTTSQATCKFQQFRVALGYGGLNRRGLSVASSFGFDNEIKQLQFATAQATYNWNCCGMTVEYRRYAIANVRNENLFRVSFTLANIGSFGNLRRQERLY